MGELIAGGMWVFAGVWRVSLLGVVLSVAWLASITKVTVGQGCWLLPLTGRVSQGTFHEGLLPLRVLLCIGMSQMNCWGYSWPGLSVGAETRASLSSISAITVFQGLAGSAFLGKAEALGTSSRPWMWDWCWSLELPL